MSTMRPAGLSDDAEVRALDGLRAVDRTLYVVGRPVPVLKLVVRPAASWDAVVPGREFPALEYRVTAAVAWYQREIAGAFGDVAAVGGGVPALFFSDEPMQCVGTTFSKSGRLHARSVIEILAEVPVDALVRSCGRIADRYERSGRQFYEVECVTSVVEDDSAVAAIRTRAAFVI
jgi:hypothetical protein